MRACGAGCQQAGHGSPPPVATRNPETGQVAAVQSNFLIFNLGPDITLLASPRHSLVWLLSLAGGHSEFQASQSFIVTPCLKKRKARFHP